jgi:nucleoside-triphosphatase
MPANVLLTGRSGCGKTTVIRKTAAALDPPAGGFCTEEMRSDGRRVGFRVIDLRTGREGILAHIDRKDRPRVGKYGVALPEFDRIGVAAVEEALARPGCIVIDEIGKMELFSSAFRDVVRRALDTRQPVLGTVTRSPHPFATEVKRRADVTLIEVTSTNRNDLPTRLLELLRGTSGA